MELPTRARGEVFLPPGSMRDAIAELRAAEHMHDLRIGIFSAFDMRTRMLPYWYADKRMAPCAVRTLADVLAACGFRHLRVVLQQWSRRVLPSQSEIAGQKLDLLLVSAMQVHAEPAYELIRDAHTLGAERPLIIAGGAKAIYEPTDYLDLESQPGLGADAVVTGEAFVLVDLLRTLARRWQPPQTLRTSFDQLRRTDALHDIPGLTYLDPHRPIDQPVAVNTGVQRLLQDLDELPLPDAGYRLLEPPHRETRMRALPLAPARVKAFSPISSLITTHGCKFNCEFCPIPAVNQRTRRHKSPARLAEEIIHLYENFGLQAFFGTDDNFFNDRETVVGLMTALATTPTRDGEPIGRKIRFYTEATQFDVHKNIDILPLCRAGGLRAIWFGLEDISAELIKKGQSPGKTEDLFARMIEIGIQPMAMVIHSDDQPVRSPKGTLSGLFNQARFLFKHGAVSYQCTYLGPAIGTRILEKSIKSKTLYRTVGGKPPAQAYHDGNHVVASAHPKPWRRQINVLRAYATFYNPWNLLRSMTGIFSGSVGPKRVLFQLAGHVGLVMTIPKLMSWAWRLWRGPIVIWQGLQPARVPMVDIHGEPMNWAIERPLTEIEPATPPEPKTLDADEVLSALRLPVLTPTVSATAS